MKKLNYIYCLLVGTLLLQSCYKDQSDLPNKPINEIEIKTNARDTINLFLGDILNITTDPSTVAQGTTSQWSIGTYSEDYFTKAVTTNLKEIATTSDLAYKTTGMGHYYLRQVVTNDHGSAIKYYHVFVNSEFEEGYLMLSKREDGTGNLSFMKKLTPEEIAAGKTPQFRQNLFEYVNGASAIIGKGPVDVDKVDTTLFILSKDDRKLYHIDHKSFKLVFTYDFRNYKDNFVPLNLISYDGRFCRELVVNSANGGSAIVQRLNLEIFPYNDIPQNITYDRSYDRPSTFSSIVRVFVNSASGNVYANGLNVNNMSFGFFPIYNYFEGSRIIQTFYNDNEELIVVREKDGVFKIARFPQSLIEFGDAGLKFTTIYDRVLTATTSNLTAQASIIVNDKYSCLFFSNGEKVFKWHYNQDNVPTAAFAQLPAGETVKYVNQSQDQTQLYVATYNVNRTGSKGSLYIYNTDTGVLIEKYEGVADEPVKVFYKVK